MLVVFGSINLDIALRTARLPAPGETVLGGSYLVSPGGKGANQAHAARRFGMRTAMVGAVGDDAFAEPALASLDQAGVELAHVRRFAGQTGCAAILVDDAAENQIVVAPGANLALRADDLPDALLADADAVLLQMENDAAETAAAVRRARAAGCIVLLNNAPARTLPADVLDALDYLIVNEGELATTARAAGLDIDLDLGPAEPEALLADLASRHRLTAVLTLGARGVVAITPDGTCLRQAASKIDPVDTTGAGDTFAGVLAAALIEGRMLADALGLASAAAGLACGRAGAQWAQPMRDEVLQAWSLLATQGR